MIAIDLPITSFEPGQKIAGVVRWDGLEVADSLSVRLMWRTSGKGDLDFCIVNEVEIETNSKTGEQPFSMTAPPHPHSFSGSLVSLVWSLEAVRFPTQEAETLDIVIAPGGREILLHKGSLNA